MRTDARPVRLTDYRPPDWLVDQVELDFRLHPTDTRVTAKLSLRPNPAGRLDAPIVLDGDGLTLTGLALDDWPLGPNAFEVTPNALTIPVPPPRPLVLTISTRIDPSANTQLMGLYRSRGTYCTQCEAEGFRRITYFPDRPDVLAVYTTRIEAERAEAPVLLANGNLVEAGDVPGTSRHFAVWRDPFPKPCYLFALVGGSLAAVRDRFVTASGRTVELAIYVEPGNEGRCSYAMDALKRAMRWDETAFGREYDLDVFNIVAVSDFNMGAMENKGLNIFNDKYVLASPDTATDTDYANIEAIIAHEYFHNWTGNRITCRDWFQLCLKEGLTVFRDQEFSSDQRSRPVKRIADVRLLKSHQFAEDGGPLAHPVRPDSYYEINNFYTSTVYEKGAEVIRMLKTLLGSEQFRTGMDLYFARHDGQAATIEDFLACFADASGRDLTQFALWYAQAGTPEVTITGAYDTRTRCYRLEVAQLVPATPGQAVKQPAVIPLKIGLVGPNGADLPLEIDGGGRSDGVIEVDRAHQAFVFRNVPARPVPSLNRGFSAPIKLTANLTEDDLLFLIRHDRDPFNRWQSAQVLAMRHLLDAVAARRDRRKPASADALIDALGRTLDDAERDPAFAAQVLMMPSEADIAREIGSDVDPDLIFAARRDLRAALARALSERLWRPLHEAATTAPYTPDATGAGRRALRNACLDLIATTGTPPALAAALRQVETADNMTERFAALSVLTLNGADSREAALARFYERYAGDHLVIDKWFGLQASIAEPGTLERVRDLMSHPAFSAANPNRVRALVGTFAIANQTQFNRSDGAGFELVAEVVLATDSRNPQLAARLLSAFKSWRALEPTRRAAAEAVLRRIAASDPLSSDVRDIVERSLG
ncbi:aminopeptidase N [Blastochloris viridis]|uniref:Aminopeptidase N n=1 Tax=Blastochloris viridis TaxID=1079 RepID=A0A0H5BPW6_BLAVI|nr:aminopeptidase N [Blastochloris viridis]ALK10095.1 Aminopeptidase N [Blastochloris viridis]BAR99978.1 membrane alanine aminopeptidase N [Blastochloris viridis]CUU42759.1 Aminopeptidase N [Blastochloris viridis]